MTLPFFRTTFFGASVLAAAIALSACGAGADGTSADDEAVTSRTTVTRPVQMNDVSVLLPLQGKSQADIDATYLSADSHPANDANGALLPRETFDLANSKTAGFRIAPTYESMRLVGFRLDPCFAQIGPITEPASCKNQLRLIFQAVRYNSASHGASADDGAFHAFYSLTRSQFIQAVNEMTALRIANEPSGDLGALAVHPIVKAQGMKGAMAKGLNAFVQKHADPKNLVKVTSFHGIFAQGTSWLFDVVDVKDGTAALSPVATLTPADTVESMRLGTAPDGLLSLSMAQSSSPDGNHLLLDPVQLETSSEGDRQVAFDAALRVENPGFHSPDTIDCATCHTAQISRQLIGEQHFKLSAKHNPNLFVADPIVPASDLALTVPVTPPTGLSLNLHAFSYDGTDPTIITRTVNETASIVAYVNTSLVKKSH